MSMSVAIVAQDRVCGAVGASCGRRIRVLGAMPPKANAKAAARVLERSARARVSALRFVDEHFQDASPTL
jgi:hypothetical protein